MNKRDVFPRALQYLIAIAEQGSYTKAAENLNVSQPTLSQQIKQLEELLQSPLLNRSGRSIRLTDAGEIYLHHARRAWGELRAGTQAINDLKNLSRGSLRVGWTPITEYLTCSMLANFYKIHPSITVNTLEMPQHEIEKSVAEATIDVGIVFSRPITNQEKPLDFELFVLFEEALCFAVGNNHPFAQSKKQIKAEELAKESLVLLNEKFALRRRIDNYFVTNKIEPNVAIETDSLSVIVEMVRLAPLSTILPSTIVASHLGLKSIMPSPELPHHNVSLIWHTGGYKSPACLAFLELAADLTARRLQDPSN